MYDTDEEYAHYRANEPAWQADIPIDDYPARDTENVVMRMTTRWSADILKLPSASTDTPDGTAWSACRRAKRPVAQCAKAQPAFYAANKALFEASNAALRP